MGLTHWLFLSVVVVFASCGAANPFGYKYYVLKPDSFKGKLEGAEESKDLPLSVCADAGGEKNRCIVMLTREAYRLKTEVLQLRQQLKDCQRGIK